MTAKWTIADDASNPPLNLTERSTAPSSPSANDIYLDDGSNTTSGNVGFRRYNGSSWEDIGSDTSIDASAVTYTPTTLTDWDSDADPGDLDDALDQLAERVDDLEGVTGVGGTLGSTDNAIPRADGTGGSTLQASGLTINDSNTLEMADNVIERAEMLDYSETVSTDTDSGATHTIDITTGNVHQLTLTANCTLTFSNPSPTGKACSFTLIVTQDGTGSRTLTYPASVDWAGGTAPTLTTDANAVDILTFLTTDAGTTWYGFLAGLDFS